MTNNLSKALDAFNSKSSTFSKKNALPILQKIEADTQILTQWIGYLRKSISKDVSDALLDSTHSAILESSACLSIGLYRPALYAIRLQLESSLAWIYFNDHPIEWENALEHGGDFPLRAQNLKYLANYSPRFASRFKLLEENSTRKVKEPYGLLSTHIHGSAKGKMPKYQSLDAVVGHKEIVDDCVTLQFSVSEYVSDIFSSWFADRWHDFPNKIKLELSKRLDPKDLKAFST